MPPLQPPRPTMNSSPPVPDSHPNIPSSPPNTQPAAPKSPPLIRHYYKTSVPHQVTALRTIRPHPGLKILPGESPPSGSVLNPHEFDTHGLDTIIILTRLIISYGIFVNKNRSPGANAFLVLTVGDLGWDAVEDIWAKRKFVDLLEPESTKAFALASSSLAELLGHPSIEGFIINHGEFQFIDSRVFVRDTTIPESPWSLSSMQIDSQNTPHPSYNSTMPYTLEEFLNRQFLAKEVGNREFQPICANPKFLFIDYRNAGDGKPIKEFRVLKLQVPGVMENKFVSIQWRYHLLAVVRTSIDDRPRGIRIYQEDGSELPPARVADFESKEPEASISPPWSLMEVGSYSLFYFRATDGKDSGQEIDLDAPEYKIRDWAME